MVDTLETEILCLNRSCNEGITRDKLEVNETLKHAINMWMEETESGFVNAGGVGGAPHDGPANVSANSTG